MGRGVGWLGSRHSEEERGGGGGIEGDFTKSQYMSNTIPRWLCEENGNSVRLAAVRVDDPCVGGDRDDAVSCDAVDGGNAPVPLHVQPQHIADTTLPPPHLTLTNGQSQLLTNGQSQLLINGNSHPTLTNSHRSPLINGHSGLTNGHLSPLKPPISNGRLSPHSTLTANGRHSLSPLSTSNEGSKAV